MIVTRWEIGLASSVAVIPKGWRGASRPPKGASAVSDDPGTGSGNSKVVSPLRKALAMLAGASTNALITTSGLSVARR